MNCAGCQSELTDLEKGDEKVRVCSNCPGVWVEVSELNALLLHKNLPGLESLGGRVAPDAASSACPSCQIDLTRIEARSRASQRHYETCEACGGVYLERDEDAPPETFEQAQRLLVEFFRKFSAK